MDTFAPRVASPAPSDKVSAAEPVVNANSAVPVVAGAGKDLVADKFMGSSGSHAYHRASCQHAARIKPENTIRFASSEDAVRAGRKPCQTCKPDGK